MYISLNQPRGETLLSMQIMNMPDGEKISAVFCRCVVMPSRLNTCLEVLSLACYCEVLGLEQAP